MVMWHDQDLLDMDRVGVELVYGTQQVMVHNGRSVSVSMDGGEAHLFRFYHFKSMNTAQNPLILLNFHSCIQWSKINEMLTTKYLQKSPFLWDFISEALTAIVQGQLQNVL